MRVRIVIPCYNEQNRLDREQFWRFFKAHPAIHFLFVNDGSTDATGDMLEGMVQGGSGQVEVMHLARNMGKAEAVRQGMLRAMDGEAGAAGYWDADLATPLEAILSFQDTLERTPHVSLVLGSRVPLLGRSIQRRWARQKLGRMFAACASWVIGLPIFDTQCGAKLLRVQPATRQLFVDPFLSRWIFDVEMLARWRALFQQSAQNDPHAGIREMPLEHWHDVAGSKLKASDFLRAIGELWRIRRKYSLRSPGAAVPAPSLPQVPPARAA